MITFRVSQQPVEEDTPAANVQSKMLKGHDIFGAWNQPEHRKFTQFCPFLLLEFRVLLQDRTKMDFLHHCLQILLEIVALLVQREKLRKDSWTKQRKLRNNQCPTLSKRLGKPSLCIHQEVDIVSEIFKFGNVDFQV